MAKSKEPVDGSEIHLKTSNLTGCKEDIIALIAIELLHHIQKKPRIRGMKTIFKHLLQ